ncbi:PilZ domain-containing protein [Thiomicrorhabdus sp. 6S2-11]|uniref:PilZ domain-containing protein n=1 Tax=Thiomicrorhabdus marina TaxID=2818442 RepID=A0ABS3Q2Q4_9GAMM|nr:PilZ domain-containing protein [Thiomicrorhabdus marina]MBO1926095.1 PilZ domain-containing protein [Thiomicrorhabdus marina]
MFQLDIEQRQSYRVTRQFEVTDFDDIDFLEPFAGNDVNLTGLSFWVEEADWFLPDQEISLRVRNLESGEIFCLDSLRVVHIQAHDGHFLCGCHIQQVTSSQLLSHHRLVITDAKTANDSLLGSEIGEFNFIEEGSPISTDPADLQEASMALDLAVAEMQYNQREGEQSLSEMLQQLKWQETTEPSLLALQQQLEKFEQFFRQVGNSAMALSILAKLIAHTPEDGADKKAWKTMLSDFENRFLTEKLQIAFDYMHQGMAPQEALANAEKLLQENINSEMAEKSQINH